MSAGIVDPLLPVDRTLSLLKLSLVQSLSGLLEAIPVALAIEVLEIDKPRYFDLLGGNADRFTFDELIRWLLVASVAIGREDVYRDVTKILTVITICECK